MIYDIAIIGGGVNGCGIARDAAGRGWSVFLCESRDLAIGTSSASTKLIHGGLRYLEQYEFRLVRKALLEREVLWGIAPHIIWPLSFVLPHHKALRPAWLLRLGLFLYDHLGGRKRLPATRTLDLRRDPAGAPLKPEFRRGFAYADCWVEDARLVVLNAMDAAERGATIATRTRCIAAHRDQDLWQLTLRHGDTGAERRITARALVNAAGPWVTDVAGGVIRANAAAKIRLVKGSHIVVPKLYDHPSCYIFQNGDGRIFFSIPYETDFTLIGTTDEDFHADPATAEASAAEIAYLCQGASAYFRVPVAPEQVVWTYSGVRPLYDDGASAAQEATRDYVLTLDAPADRAALLSVFGGKITTYRRLAEAALEKLAPLLPAPRGERPGWTGHAPLPGGDFADFDQFLAGAAQRYPFLPPALLRRLARAYGSRIEVILRAANSLADLGEDYGAGLTAAELRYLVTHEWARTAADVVWRRGKLGLRLNSQQIAAIDAAIAALLDRAPALPLPEHHA
jgi:glycerol-3-phosphate dehydrogenase